MNELLLLNGHHEWSLEHITSKNIACPENRFVVQKSIVTRHLNHIALTMNSIGPLEWSSLMPF
jgi:hypothetical protein